MATAGQWICLTAGVLALGACHRSTPNAATPVETPANSVDYAARIAELPPRSRAGVFLRAVRDAGLDCQSIVSQKPHDPIKGYSAWTVQCDNGSPFVLVVEPGGVLQVVPATIDRSGS